MWSNMVSTWQLYCMTNYYQRGTVLTVLPRKPLAQIAADLPRDAAFLSFQACNVQVTPQDVSSLLRGLKSLVERGSGEAAAVLAQVLAHLAADDSDAQVPASLPVLQQRAFSGSLPVLTHRATAGRSL